MLIFLLLLCCCFLPYICICLSTTCWIYKPICVRIVDVLYCYFMSLLYDVRLTTIDSTLMDEQLYTFIIPVLAARSIRCALGRLVWEQHISDGYECIPLLFFKVGFIWLGRSICFRKPKWPFYIHKSCSPTIYLTDLVFWGRILCIVKYYINRTE